MTPIYCRGCNKELLKYDENAEFLFLGSILCSCLTDNKIDMWIHNGVKSYGRQGERANYH